jgi:hypothetical protein
VKSIATLFWTAAIALLSFLCAAFAWRWAYIEIPFEPDLLRIPAVMAGIVLLFAAATYGAIEVVRRFRRCKAHVYPPVATLLMVIMLLSAGKLITNGLRAAKRTAATRILEDLRMIDSPIDTACGSDTYVTRWEPEPEPFLPELHFPELNVLESGQKEALKELTISDLTDHGKGLSQIR